MIKVETKLLAAQVMVVEAKLKAAEAMKTEERKV